MVRRNLFCDLNMRHREVKNSVQESLNVLHQAEKMYHDHAHFLEINM